MMHPPSRFHSCPWALIVAILLVIPAWAIEQHGPDNRGPNTNMTAEPKIVQDAVALANQISRALSQSGYNADFSLESLKEVDRFFDEHVTSGRANPGGLLSQQLGARLFALGSYVGEVIRRHGGGQWQGDDNDPEAEINIAIRLPSGAILWPAQRVMKRFKNGAEDSIWVYGVALTSAR
jgi:hypothetical protein